MYDILIGTNSNLPQIVLDANAQSGFADYVRILGDGNILNGSIIATIQQDSSKAFIDAYKTRYGTEPPFFADLGYDGFELLMNTYDKPKLNKQRLIGALWKIEPEQRIELLRNALQRKSELQKNQQKQM